MLEKRKKPLLALQEVNHLLQKADITNSNNEAIWILEHVLEKIKSDFLQNSQEMSIANWQKIQNITRQRIGGKPLAYILKTTSFWKYDFFLKAPVLIPRKETEVLLETALKIIQKNAIKDLLEVGCGCGALCLSLALEQKLNITAIDIAKDAIIISKKNQKKHQKELCKKGSNLNFLQEDAFCFLQKKNQQFAMIISNPPYIAYNEKQEISPEVLKFEDKRALFAEKNGLSFYEFFAHHTKKKLTSKGFIVLEHGYKQKQKIIDIFTQQNWKYILSKNDLSGKNRVLVFQNL